MLLLFQVPPQTIHFTVQQPPGLPFWETAIISAVTGAFFGFASSIAMEFVKARISSRLLKKTISKELDAEFSGNYSTLLDALELTRIYDSAPEADQQDVVMVVKGLRVTMERFTHYKQTHMAAFHEADEGYRLGKFYVLLEAAYQDFPKDRALLHVAGSVGQELAKFRNLGEIKPSSLFIDAFTILQRTRTKGRINSTG